MKPFLGHTRDDQQGILRGIAAAGIALVSLLPAPALSGVQGSQAGATPSAQASPPLRPVPKELATFFSGALRRWPAFAKGSGRDLQPELLGVESPLGPFPIWIVEVRYREKGVIRPGIALIVDVPKAEKQQPGAEKELTAREGPWAVATIFEGEAYEPWTRRMEQSRREANEMAAVADIRSVLSGEAVFESISGTYGDLGCLNAPASCLPGSKEPPIIKEEFTAAERAGYRRTFHAGAPAKGKAKRGLATFAFTAVPMDASAGRRAFCGDSAGVVCAIADGAMPPIVGGVCPKSCVPLP